jgi:hypothetical protein
MAWYLVMHKDAFIFNNYLCDKILGMFDLTTRRIKATPSLDISIVGILDLRITTFQASEHEFLYPPILSRGFLTSFMKWLISSIY